MAINGVDIAWARPTVAQIKASGAHFVCRYLSPDSTKNITAQEVKDYHAAGLGVVVIWESVAGRMKSGYAAGKADAIAADKQRKAVGLPADQPIYFACDFDATASEYHAINEYMRGVNDVIGLSRSGFYGGYYVVQNVASAPTRAHYYWQTVAWSSGHWSAHANIRQTGATTLSGQADKDVAITADYGQYPRPSAANPAPKPATTTTTKGADMELSSEVILPAWAPKAWPTDTGLKDGKIAVNTALGSGYSHARATHDDTTEILAEIATIKTALAAIAKKIGA